MKNKLKKNLKKPEYSEITSEVKFFDLDELRFHLDAACSLFDNIYAKAWRSKEIPTEYQPKVLDTTDSPHDHREMF